jgi:flagella basal body P-ring formation protein FlgA
MRLFLVKHFRHHGGWNLSHRNCFKYHGYFIALLLFFTVPVHADPADRLSFLFTQTLEEKYSRPENKADIEIPSLETLANSNEVSQFVRFTKVRLIDDRANGMAIFEINGFNAENKAITQTVQTPFKAWIKAPIANHRIFPNSKLKAEDFKIQTVNVSSGMGREYRGVIVAPTTNFEKMETRQTILEGQFLVSTAIQKQPDVRKGEMVRLDLMAGDLTLTTQAVILEGGSVGDRIHVLTVKTKKEIIGTLNEDHAVEVNL